MTNNIPPRQTSSELPGTPPDHPGGYEHLPPADLFSGGMPHQGLMIHGPSTHDDANAFPVLKAFQDYLEMERQQARKRLLTLTIVFASLMTLVVIGFIGAIIILFGAMSKREDHLMDVALLQKKEPRPSTSDLVNLTSQQVAKEIQTVALNLQTNLGSLQTNLGSLQTHLSSQIAVVGSAATNLDNKVEAQNIEMTKLRDTLAALQKENASMRAELPKLALEAARKIQPPAAPAIPTPIPAARPNTSTASPATATAGTPAAATGKPPQGYDEAVLSIRSHDGENSIPWRTFLPQ